MSFIEQTAKIFSNTAEFKFQVAMFGRDAFYIEGARPIKIDESELIFKTQKELITVTGERLAVRELTSDCMSVVGMINAFTVTEL